MLSWKTVNPGDYADSWRTSYCFKQVTVMSLSELFAFHTCTTTKKEVLHWTEKLRATHADSTLAQPTINVHQDQVHYHYLIANTAFYYEQTIVNTMPKMRNSLHLMIINNLHCYLHHDQTGPGNLNIPCTLALLIISQDIIHSIRNHKSKF